VSGASTDLFDLADEMLNVCEGALQLIPAGCPDRAYVAHGLPAIDCEQLCVSVYTTPWADTNPRNATLDRQFKTKYGSLNLVFLTVSIVRCYPGPTANGRATPILPRVAELTAASQKIYEDGWQLWNGIQTAKRLGAFAGVCRELAMDPMLPIQPSGGFAGWTIPVEVQLDGFPVAFPSTPV
jgi:hypothetical protein